MTEVGFVVEPLGSQHDRSVFSCGEPALDRYLLAQASQDVRRRVAQIFVAVGAIEDRIAGYYSLSAASFDKAELPAVLGRKLPHYPVPAAILGRLAVDRGYQGRGLGEFLLLDAARRVLQASEAMGVHALIVDALNERARDFYRRYGFEAFPSLPGRLFLPLEVLAKAWR